MRLLSVIASPAPGGAENLVANLSSELVGRGHKCHVLFLSDAQSVGNPAEFEREFLRKLGEAGVTHDVLDSRCLRNPFRSGRRLRAVCMGFAPDILHVHVARGLLSRLFSGIRPKTVYSHHSVRLNLPGPLFRILLRTADRCVAVGQASREFLQNFTSREVVLVPNGASGDFQRQSAREGFSANPLILAVGTLRAAKDYPNLVRAAALAVPRFAAKGRRVRFAIAGEGEERAALETLIRDHGLSGYFTLLGARSDVAQLMREADLLVNSSAYEGLPVTLIEATMSGLPAVATDVGGNSEIIRNGANGRLVPPADPGALAEAMISILEDEQRYAALSKAALTIARGFSMEACADEHLAIYEALAPG